MGNWNDDLREPRIGVLLHYDASVSDASAVQWLTRDPRCKVSYTWLILDDGSIITVAPPDARAWHAGICRASDPRLPYRDANSAFYGLSLAATAGDRATPAALTAIADLTRALFGRHGWDTRTELWRIVGHSTEAWPRGRKVDPVGPDPARPVLRVEEIRQRVRPA